ncbi:hypothetical protein KFL_015480010, partial [Klebsormidium nitens]
MAVLRGECFAVGRLEEDSPAFKSLVIHDPQAAAPLVLLLALTSSVTAGRVLLQSCPTMGSTCYTAGGTTGYCCPSGFNCFSSDTFTCYTASASYPSDPSTAFSNGFTAGSTPPPTTGSPGPAGSPPTESPVAPGPASTGTDS